MKYVYVIVSELYMPDTKRYQPSGHIGFACTSLDKAREQMLKIMELINDGKWYVDDGITKHTAEPLRRFFPELTNGNPMMDFKVYHSKGDDPKYTHSIYSVQRCKLNQGYGI